MRTSSRHASTTVLTLLAAAALSGCQAKPHGTAAGPGADKPRVATAVINQQEPRPTAAYAFPTGRRAGGVLMVEARGPEEVTADEPFNYEVRVQNMADTPLHGVRLREHGRADLRLTASSPPGQRMPDGASVWDLGTLEPNEVRNVVIEAEPLRSGLQELCLTAEYTPVVCLATMVIQPELEIIKTGPTEVLVCDPIEYTLEIFNAGVGAARNVRVIEELPPGMRTIEGRRTLEIDIGTLEAGQLYEYAVRLQAAEPGEFTNVTRVVAADGLTDRAEFTTRVTEPVLRLTKDAPQEDYAGVPVEYVITIENVGDGPARETVLEERLPEGMTFVRGTDDPRAEAGQILWELGTIEPDEQRTVRLHLQSNALGEVENIAVARAYCARETTAATVTRLVGVPALLLELVDDVDPVRVGDTTTYTITVTNQGRIETTGISLLATLEDAVEFVSATGPTEHRVVGERVEFAPLPMLPAGEQAVWRVTVRGIADADSRFLVEMNSEQLGRPVRTEESTRIFE